MAYELTEDSLTALKEKKLDAALITSLEKLLNQDFDKESLFIKAVSDCIGEDQAKHHKKDIINAARKSYAVLKNKAARQALREWWQELEEIKLPNGKKKSNRGARAKLRRCEKPEDILLEPYFYELQQQLPDINSTLTLASVAGLLSHVSKDGEYNFPKQLGKEKEHSGKAVFSELRFQQLLASHDIDELYENLRRAIIQLKRTAHILSLADGVLHWAQEYSDRNQFDERPERRFQFTWAKAYFRAVLEQSKPTKGA
jgi:CRISPR system Cascade subunit CasB